MVENAEAEERLGGSTSKALNTFMLTIKKYLLFFLNRHYIYK